MKKVINVGNVLLLTIVFILGVSNICFADLVGVNNNYHWDDPTPTPSTDTMSPIEETIQAIPFQLKIVLAILGVLFLITLFCIIISKICKAEELLKKSKIVLENLFYYILLIIGIMSVLGIKELSHMLMWVTLLEVLFSLLFRIIFKKKKESYIILFIYFIVAIYTYMKIIWLV